MTINAESTLVDAQKHAKVGLQFYEGINYKFYSPAVTLENLLDKHNIQNVDILSLDVEGGEMQVLLGSNLKSSIIKNHKKYWNVLLNGLHRRRNMPTRKQKIQICNY